LRDHDTGRRGDNRQHVLVPVRIDPDHVIHLVCKHIRLILRLHS